MNFLENWTEPDFSITIRERAAADSGIFRTLDRATDHL